MRIDLDKYNINDPKLGGSLTYAKEEGRNLVFTVSKVSDLDNTNEGHPQFQIEAEISTGKNSGSISRQRYRLTPASDSGGGMLWKVRNLFIACGIYEMETVGGRELKKITSLSTETLVGKRFIGDLVKKGAYLNIENEKEYSESLAKSSFDVVASGPELNEPSQDVSDIPF